MPSFMYNNIYIYLCGADNDITSYHERSFLLYMMVNNEFIRFQDLKVESFIIVPATQLCKSRDDIACITAF